jgi:hypothetical protein
MHCVEASESGRQSALRRLQSDDQFFEILDGRIIAIGVDKWRLEMHALVLEGDRRWLQLSVHAPTPLHIYLSMTVDQSPDHALARLRAFLSDWDARALRSNYTETVTLH